jgi:hypothetical protein
MAQGWENQLFFLEGGVNIDKIFTSNFVILKNRETIVRILTNLLI